MYTTETISELYDIKELPEGTFTLKFKLIDLYKRDDPFLIEKLKYTKYQKGYFCRSCNTIKLATYKEKIDIPQKLKNYIVKWYHTYLLHSVLYRMEKMILQHLYWSGIR